MFKILISILGFFISISNCFSNTAHMTSVLTEKVYLHIDRSIYSSGDDIWFKAYVIDALSNLPSLHTSNLHVELISPTAEIIQSRVIRIENGLGKGDFNLSDSVPSGRYLIRAYTNFMRNFSDEFFFNKEIVVINSVDKGNGLNDSTKYVNNILSISFFPEGGSLVDGIQSVVAFKAVNALGKGCDVTGKVLSSSGELVTLFKSSHLGMGTFHLKPVKGITYHALVTSKDGTEYSYPMPKSFSTGITLHTFVLEGKRLLLKVSTNEETLASVRERKMVLTFSSRNLFTKTMNFAIDTLVRNLIVPLDDFPEGIIRVTLLEDTRLPFCERLFFFGKNRDLKIFVSSDRILYKPREQVKINISLPGDTSSQQIAYLSLSAAEKRNIGDSTAYPTSIASWFLLESDVRGIVEDPSYYFDVSNAERFNHLDLLLLTQGWRDFQWKYEADKLFKEEKGFSISGMAAANSGKKKSEVAKINFGIMDERACSFFSAETDSAGRFRTDGIDINGIGKVVASVTDKKNRLGGDLFLDSMVYSPAQAFILEHEEISLLPFQYSALKQETQYQYLINKKYNLSDTISLGEVSVTAKRPEKIQAAKIKSSRLMYGNPDKEVIMTPQMQTKISLMKVLDGRLPGVEVHMVSDRTGTVRIRGMVPLVLVDGVPSVEGLNTPPYMVDRVDILYWSSPYGSRGANGIINIITRTGELNFEALNMSYSKTMNIKGFDMPRVFYSPVYNTTNSAGMQPDLRTTIYWEPDILIKAGSIYSNKFFNSDKTGKVEINVEGLTNDGIPVSSLVRYEVIKN